MKPISLKFKCFGPYMDEQFIDFEDLRNFGLFLIAGNTGAGKTTILDAVCMALYAQSSGGKRGELSDMRCKLAGPSDVTYVEYVFESEGVRYKFYREVKMARKNLSETHNCLRLEDGGYVPLMANPKKTTVNDEAERILHLTAEQFRQIIILPQGQFERLLVSSSKEKEEILTQVFHAERWNRIVEILKRRVKAETDSLNELFTGIQTSLRNESAESVEALKERLTELTAEIEKLKADGKKAEADKSVTAKAYEKALEENRDFEAAEKAQEKYDGFKAKEPDMKIRRASLEKAKKADSVRDVYAAEKAATDGVTAAADTLSKALKALEHAEKTEAAKKTELEELLKKCGAVEEIKRKKTLMENALENYRTLGVKKEALEAARQAEAAAKKEAEQAEKAFRKAEQLFSEKCNERNACMEELNEANRIYNAGAAVRLGRMLAEGMACPVCGSKNHPCIAHVSDSDREITDADLSALNTGLGKAVEAVSEAEKSKNLCKDKHDNASEKYTAEKLAAARSEAEYNSARRNMIEGIETLNELERAIKKAASEVASFENNKLRLTDECNNASREVTSKKTTAEASKKALEEAESNAKEKLTEWQEALVKAAFATEEDFMGSLWDKSDIEAENRAAVQFDADYENARVNLKECLERIDGRTKPELETLKRRKEEADRNYTGINNELGKREANCDRLTGLYESVSRSYEKYRKDAERVNKDEELMKKLEPKSGVSLKRYVLGVMFGSVIDAANRLLENVQGGRYRLARTDDTSSGTNQGGLELEVFDADNGKSRGVSSLSGGEKFLVALSLAIGLSTVIQAQSHGIRLEAMFIDEGFGSLDEKSIGEAVEVLGTVQAGHGLVGVISHVEKLRGLLPYCIEVVKDEHGNYIKAEVTMNKP